MTIATVLTIISAVTGAAASIVQVLKQNNDTSNK